MHIKTFKEKSLCYQCYTLIIALEWPKPLIVLMCWLYSENNLMDFMLVLSEDYFIDSYIVLRFSIKKSLQIPSEALLS